MTFNLAELSTAGNFYPKYLKSDFYANLTLTFNLAKFS